MAWHDRALDAMLDLAREGRPCSSDDLIDLVGVPDSSHGANGANSAIGAIFREAAAKGWIVPTGTVTKSRQPRRKGGMVQLWVGAPGVETLQLELFPAS